MTISRVGITTPADVAGVLNAASVTRNTPAGVGFNDLLIAQIMHRTTGQSTPPAGWTLLHTSTATYTGGSQTTEIWTRTAVATEPVSHTWTFPATSARATGAIVAYRNARVHSFGGGAANEYTASGTNRHAPASINLATPIWHGRLLQISSCVYADSSTSQKWVWNGYPEAPNNNIYDPAYQLWGSTGTARVHAAEFSQRPNDIPIDVTRDAGDFTYRGQYNDYNNTYDSLADAHGLGSTHAWTNTTLLLAPTDLEPAPARANDAAIQAALTTTTTPGARAASTRLSAITPAADWLTGFEASPYTASDVSYARRLPTPSALAYTTGDVSNQPPRVTDNDTSNRLGDYYNPAYWVITPDTDGLLQVRVLPPATNTPTLGANYAYLNVYTSTMDLLGRGTLSSNDATELANTNGTLPLTTEFPVTAGTPYYLVVTNDYRATGWFQVETQALPPTMRVSSFALSAWTKPFQGSRLDYTLTLAADVVPHIAAPPVAMNLRLRDPIIVDGTGHADVDVDRLDHSLDVNARSQPQVFPPALQLGPLDVDLQRLVTVLPVQLDLGHLQLVGDGTASQYVHTVEPDPLDVDLGFSARAKRATLQRNPGRNYRWEMFDPRSGEHWTMPINPDSMTSPHRVREGIVSSGARHSGAPDKGYRMVTNMPPPQAKRWEFSGVIRTRDHYQHLVEWSLVDSPIHISDHLNRTWEVVVEEFVPDEKRPTYRTSWRFRYTMRTLILRRVR